MQTLLRSVAVMNQLLLLQAIAFATHKHRFQRRKDGKTPYINHPIHVALILSEIGHVEDGAILAAAVLHDTVEDTDTTLDEIEAHFGARVRSLVAEVTDDPRRSPSEQKQHQLDHAAELSIGATLIRIADKTSNVTDLYEAPAENWSVARRQSYLLWAEAMIARCRPVNAALEKNFATIAQKAREQLGMVTNTAA
ncbi:MAG: bifunctional (p)ppGpp synthetase/guanosine-3',5'-bis(diphosphate) 3'-pyrophosphohydrolase [Synechococcales cyanobacterium RU_4_20]|nr:bifunctional (p)ppGpp synthetase/guanosine-3',5'-bis(diphosphate) 3'-pyrophosphohydrolase [Synechococcales cyanobacterium RU_4_20]